MISQSNKKTQYQQSIVKYFKTVILKRPNFHQVNLNALKKGL